MSRATGIEWTDATWNPIRGCSRVEKRLLDPLRWKKPQKISMSDLFHEGVTDEMLDRIFAVMALCPQHTFQVLTKRPERMRAYVSALVAGKRIVALRGAEVLTGEKDSDSRAFCEAHSRMLGLMDRWSPNPLPNVWLGVSVENQKAADERIPLLLQTPAAVRFLSVEPLLGPVDLLSLPRVGQHHDYLSGERMTSREMTVTPHLDWVIVGGESGPGARPMHPDWARSLRDQCAAAGVPFFFKQWGEWFGYSGAWRDTPVCKTAGSGILWPNHVWPDQSGYVSTRCGKKIAGHLLDGEVIQQFPERVA